MFDTTFHQNNKLYNVCKSINKNLHFIFLHTYSLELDPIEKYWAILKRKLKKIV